MLELTVHSELPTAPPNSRQAGRSLQLVIPREKQELAEETQQPRGPVLAAGSMASVSRLPVNDAGASGSLAPGHAYHRNPHTGHRALEKSRNCLILPMRNFLLKAYTLHFVPRISA